MGVPHNAPVQRRAAQRTVRCNRLLGCSVAPQQRVTDGPVSSFPIAALRVHAVGSKALVSTVAEGRFPRALALTERHLSLLFDEELNGDEVRALVGAVIVWLVPVPGLQEASRNSQEYS